MSEDKKKMYKINGNDKVSKNRVSEETTSTLRKVKIMLMSRELKQKNEAVAWLFKELNVDSNVGQDLLIITLLKFEIVALLCEIIMEMDSAPLVTLTLNCLAKLTISEQFYRQNHASYAVASILTAGHFLTLENNASNNQLVMLQGIAQTLEKIFEGATTFRLMPNEICELDQIFGFFKKLLTAESQAYRTIFSAAKIISVILRYVKIDDYAVKNNSENEVLVLFTVIESTLNLMRRIVEAKNSKDGKFAFRALVMICLICSEAITSCVENDRNVNEITGKPKSTINHKENLANCVYTAIMKSVIPNFNKIELDEKYEKFYNFFVTTLNGIYDVGYCNARDLSNYLVEQGFLQSLPRLTIYQTSNWRNETLLLLSRILTTLATFSLSADTWLGGTKQFQKFIFNAFKSLPIDPSNWIKFLTEGDDRADALIVLFYYNFLAESISDAASYLPLIVAYVMSSTSLKIDRKSIGIKKARWFTLSIAAVSHEDPSKIEFYEQGITRLFNDLESCDIKQCYTHHPAVIIHCLRSAASISNEIRSKVVCLWLENGGDVSCIVDATGKNDLTNYYSLLEMVKTGSPQIVDVAMKAISELVKNPETIEILGNITWDMLQQILAPGYVENDYNTTSVLKLAVMFEPAEISGLNLVCFLYRLTTFILKNENDLILVSLGIRVAYGILSSSVRRNDVRGVKMFTNKPKLIKLLKNLAFTNTDAGLSYLCFNSLSTLIRYQANYSIQCENPVEIESYELLQQLYLENCFGGVKLATSIFTSEIDRPVIILRDVSRGGQNYEEVIRKIYIQLHMIHSKSGIEGRNLCYALLIGILSHCSAVKNDKLLKILCEVDWTFILIDITIQGKEIMDTEFMDFISEWLSHRYVVSPLSQPSGKRSLCRDQFETTLDLLGKAALTNHKKYPIEESLQELIQSLILFEEHFSGNIANELREADITQNKDRN